MDLLKKTQFAFIGCGVMAESIVAGLLLKKLVDSKQITASHPRPERRENLEKSYGIKVFEDNIDAIKFLADENSILVLCVKPQRMKGVLQELKGSVKKSQLVISIIAGAKIETISNELDNDLIVRTMPNTPSQIGQGMTAWTCAEKVSDEQKAKVKVLLSALGKELYVETENQIDMATSLSATGPTYIFMLMEALTDAGVHLGFSREVSKELVQQTMLGSTLFAMESHKHPAELRNMVTSPGGTSAAAIYEMEKGTMRTVLSKAVYAAYKRAVELGEKK
jgi:pyrroline-5-carboxylate reductase